MEPLGQRIREYLGKNQPALSVTWTSKVRSCDTCGREYEAKVRTVEGNEVVSCLVCQECREKRMRENERNRALQELQQLIPGIRAKWLEQCGLPEKFKAKTLENFEAARQPRAYERIKGYQGGSIVLLSPELYGVGKTHLVAALINRLITTSEPARITGNCDVITNRCPVLFVTENDLLARIRATFNRRNEGETEEDIYHHMEAAPLLVIDDVGKVQPNDYKFLQGVYFRVLDFRYANNKPVIMTTNLDYAELEAHIGGACADRLREMCGKGGFIKMTGESYRKR